MPKTVLVMDGRGLPRLLTERLGALGCVCLYARGPLRAGALLSQHTVDLILWKDNTGSRDLSAELFAEWRRHPDIPVIRLYAKGLTAPAGTDVHAFSVALAANLPYDTPEPQLLAAVGACLDASLATDGPGMRNELAFRHVVTALRRHPPAAEDGIAAGLAMTDGSTTAVGTSERELLREHVAERMGDPRSGPGPWWKVWNRWVPVRRAPAGP